MKQNKQKKKHLIFCHDISLNHLFGAFCVLSVFHYSANDNNGYCTVKMVRKKKQNRLFYKLGMRDYLNDK